MQEVLIGVEVWRLMADPTPFSQGPDWLKVINDTELRRELGNIANSSDFMGMIRAAFVLLERRIRESAGLQEHDYGKDLIDKAFHAETGILQPVSPVGSERSGLYNLLLGIFLYYRNPIAHRPVYHTPESAIQVLSLVDHALQLVKQAVELSFNLDNLVGGHEGQILRRRDYRLDIDGDGKLEVVVLLELGPVAEGDKLVPHLLPIILRKNESEYHRIPSEWVSGVSMWGPGGVALRHVTNPQMPDIIATWTWGNSQAITILLKHQNDKYVLAKRDFPPETTEPYSGPIRNGFLLHMRQEMNFADVDGDGLDEMVQMLSFDPDDLVKMGYTVHPERSVDYFLLSRVWKWDSEKEAIRLMEERLVTRSRVLPPYLA